MAKSADKGCGISGKLPSKFVETFMSIRPWRKTALNAGTSRRDAHVGLLFWGSTASGVLCLYCCKCVLWPLLEEETSFQWYQIQELFHGGFFGLAQHERLREILWRFVWRSSFWVKHVVLGHWGRWRFTLCGTVHWQDRCKGCNQTSKMIERTHDLTPSEICFSFPLFLKDFWSFCLVILKVFRFTILSIGSGWSCCLCMRSYQPVG